MILTLIVKKKETQDGRKFNSFSANRGDKWYAVKFVKDCPAPRTISVEDNVQRAFIRLEQDDKFDIRQDKKDPTRNVLYIENYRAIDDETLAKCVEVERKKIAAYREEREKAKMDFLLPVDGEDLPF